MRLTRLTTALCGVLWLGACAAPEFQDPAAKQAAMASFAAGTAKMSCGAGMDCMIKWNLVRPSVTNLVQAGRWNDVAVSVLATGYDVDLAWYYLGLAAANLNEIEPARGYFDMAAKRAVEGGLFSCQSSGASACDGVNLPADASTAMASLPPPVVAEAEPPPPPPVHHHHKKKSSTSTASNWVAPVSASGAAPDAAPAASASAPSGSGSTWVAPSATTSTGQ